MMRLAGRVVGGRRFAAAAAAAEGASTGTTTAGTGSVLRLSARRLSRAQDAVRVAAPATAHALSLQTRRANPSSLHAGHSVNLVHGQRRHNSSFIKRVMEQVKQDLDKDKTFQDAKKDLDSKEAKEQAEKLKAQAARQEENLKKMKQNLDQTVGKGADFMSKIREQAAKQQEAMREQMKASQEEIDKATEENESLKATRESLRQGFGKLSETGSAFFGRARSAFSQTVDKGQEFASGFEDRDKKSGNRKWQAQRDLNTVERELKEKQDSEIQRAAEALENVRSKQADAEAIAATQARKAAEDAGKELDPKDVEAFVKEAGKVFAEEIAAAEAQLEEVEQRIAAEKEAKEKEEAAEAAANSALVVKKQSAWDKMGGLGDMPLLNSFYENPLFDRLLSETEIAQSVREMQEAGVPFDLWQFQEEMEHVVAPYVVKAYLEGNSDTLQHHLGEAAFAAVSASFKERRAKKQILDPTVCLPPTEVELKAAKPGEGGMPSFVFTFHTQQINCMRSAKKEDIDEATGEGKVVEGKVDDVRMVYYAIAVTRHPYTLEDYEPEEGQGVMADLEFPWLIQELAIVGNQPTW